MARWRDGRWHGGRESARFAQCNGNVRVTCAIDGDTIWYQGTKIRIADINAPEVSKPGCACEAMLGERATDRHPHHSLTCAQAGSGGFELGSGVRHQPE